MKLAYYPGCTLKNKAFNMEDSALSALKALGCEVEELPRWNCCGALFSLADDSLIYHMAPVRNLIRAQENDKDAIITLCGQCYNTIARANKLMQDDEEKRDTINRFMDEEPDYTGAVQVIHYLTFLRDQVGWDKLKKAVKVPLKGLKVAPFYGCNLIRPADVAIADSKNKLLEDFLEAIGATPVAYGASNECCGSYQSIAHPEAGAKRAAEVIVSARNAGAEAIALSCPMCEYNLGTCQEEALAAADQAGAVPTYYFTQLLAIALGLDPAVCHFELGNSQPLNLLLEGA